ncbi:YfhJ family protein [Edaphobacillus lindanitolerans]|uniref:WVELL protein n=1 Tax=Edaphobacillus lindanitolerans TaxID=550447 RepID=A0A1U7PRT6_9BACI|nr:YfhJ family protein [Edaphobacillus lindanitolerans]SIT93170.1 WVELL protein [Edaphobacillus lindanitolerans]
MGHDQMEALAVRLMEENGSLSADRARTWSELLVSDIESSYARAGYGMMEDEQTVAMVNRWIDAYGSRLDEFKATNLKIAALLDEEGPVS